MLGALEYKKLRGCYSGSVIIREGHYSWKPVLKEVQPCWIVSLLNINDPKGLPQLKNPKISASGRNFLDPLPPYSNFDRADENVGISYLKVIIKFGFFQISNPPSPYFGRMLNLTDDVNWGGP